MNREWQQDESTPIPRGKAEINTPIITDQLPDPHPQLTQLPCLACSCHDYDYQERYRPFLEGDP